MKTAFELGEKLFFNILLICITAFIYFEIIVNQSSNFIVQIMFILIYFLINFYYGYKNNLNIKDSLTVGVMGSGLGIFLSFFSLCSYIFIESTDKALLFSSLYLSPTYLIIDNVSGYMNISYVFIIICINISLVVLGGISRKYMNKVTAYFK